MTSSRIASRGWASRAAAGFVLCLAAAGAQAQVERAEAPFGDKVSERVPFYHRAAPTVATAGPLGRLGLIEAKAVGFRSVINLGPSTTAAGLDDPAMAEYARLVYVAIPLGEPLPTPGEVDRIRQFLDDPKNGPVLLYGPDADSAAAAWALVRAAQGVPPEIALQDGLTAGLRDRLPAVRARLGLAGAR